MFHVVFEIIYFADECGGKEIYYDILETNNKESILQFKKN